RAGRWSSGLKRRTSEAILSIDGRQSTAQRFPSRLGPRPPRDSPGRQGLQSRRSPMFSRPLRAIAVACFCAAGASAFAQMEIKLGHVGEPGSIFQKAADEFARRANAKLGNKAKVVVYGSSQLGGDKEMLQ